MAEATPPDTGKEMETVASADGTEIAFERTGSGPPLVLVHGAGGDHTVWEFCGVRSTLADHCTVYAVDRRGRGESGDAAPHDLEREIEDVVTVVDAIDEPVTLYGQSYGGLCALEAALRTDNLRGLVLYEPISGDADLARSMFDEVLAEIQPLIDDGEHEQAFVFLLEGVELPPETLDAVRSTPAWREVAFGADKLPREFQAEGEYEFDASRFTTMTTPTLLIEGGESMQLFKEGTEAVDDALPNSKIATIDGHGHGVNLTAPDRFTDEILTFISEME
jgi:pimeloyl-ACP methyl ester carboxylesterase